MNVDRMNTLDRKLQAIREIPDVDFTIKDWKEYRATTLDLCFENYHDWSKVVDFLQIEREKLIEGMSIEFYADILHEAKQRKVTSDR
jgi:hypothetical protein